MSKHLKSCVSLTVLSATVMLAACGGGGGTIIPQLAAASPAAFVGDCADLSARVSSLSNTTVTAVNKIAAGTVVLAGASVPEHCQVLGTMHTRTGPLDSQSYAIGFEMRLPKAWNGRFFHLGNGGTDGNVNPAYGNFGGGATTNALLQGFAVLSSNAGHSAAQNALGAFGVDPQARLDYGYQAVGKLTPMAKSVINAAYSKNPDRSYFGGCSNGGRHAMVTATRYFNDYDGILAGAPGYNLPLAATANMAGARQWATVATVANPTTGAQLATAFTDTERTLVSNAIIAKCDALDGVADNYVADVAACQSAFNLTTDVPTCSGARDGTCLSSAQKTVISNVWSGVKTSAGKKIYSSFPYDAGISGGSSTGASFGPGSGSGIAGWKFGASLALDPNAAGVIFQVPPVSPVGFVPSTFAMTADIDALYANLFTTNSTYTESAMSFMTPQAPTEMFGLRNRGGKILAYHGNSDPIFSVNDTVAWYDGLTANHGSITPQFARLFRVPQMGHCSGGPAADQFDMLTPLVNWVEQGIAPSAITVTARGAGNVGGANAEVPSTWSAARTRLLCSYPAVAKFVSGNVESAASFSCQ